MNISYAQNATHCQSFTYFYAKLTYIILKL